jgi:capsular polysaccharide biosynthesis protein
MIPCGHSKTITNEVYAIVATTEVGFEVVAVGLEVVSNMAQLVEVVNKCDVLLGIHGTGLTNFVFLPHGGTVVQIIPWGEFKWVSLSHYRDLLPDKGLRYAKYEVTS